MKQIKIDKLGITLTRDGKGGLMVNTPNRMHCPSCGSELCIFDCDESQWADSKAEVEARLNYNTAMRVVEQFVVSHYYSGIDITSDKYTSGIKLLLDELEEDYERGLKIYYDSTKG